MIVVGRRGSGQNAPRREEWPVRVVKSHTTGGVSRKVCGLRGIVPFLPMGSLRSMEDANRGPKTMLLLILALVYGVSWYLARAAACSWLGARKGSHLRLVFLGGSAVTAAVGFTWCYLVAALYAAHSLGLVVSSRVEGVVELGKVVVATCTIVAILAAAAETWRSRRHDAAASATASREPRTADQDGAMIVLCIILAGTGALGIVQTYWIIRSRIASAAPALVRTCR